MLIFGQKNLLLHQRNSITELTIIIYSMTSWRWTKTKQIWSFYALGRRLSSVSAVWSGEKFFFLSVIMIVFFTQNKHLLSQSTHSMLRTDYIFLKTLKSIQKTVTAKLYYWSNQPSFRSKTKLALNGSLYSKSW